MFNAVFFLLLVVGPEIWWLDVVIELMCYTEYCGVVMWGDAFGWRGKWLRV